MKLIGRDDLVDDPKYINCVKMNEAGLNAEVVGVMDDALAKMTCTEAPARSSRMRAFLSSFARRRSMSTKTRTFGITITW